MHFIIAHIIYISSEFFTCFTKWMHIDVSRKVLTSIIICRNIAIQCVAIVIFSLVCTGKFVSLLQLYLLFVWNNCLSMFVASAH